MIRILSLLEEIKEAQRIHGSNICARMHMLKATNNVPTLPDGVKLPLINMKTFELMEMKLADLAFQSEMSCNFVKIYFLFKNHCFFGYFLLN